MRHESQADTVTAAPALASTMAASEAAAAEPRGIDLARGDMVGRYTILTMLGRGGMGVVFAAYDPELNRKVAIKLLLGGASEVAQSQIVREAQALARLSHPNVVTIYDVGIWREYIWLAMEFIDGGTLRTWLTTRPRHWREIVAAFAAAGAGLEAAHASGLVHRDFKPENVMLASSGRVYVTDFGLARLGDDTANPTDDDELVRGSSPGLSLERTREGALTGTPAYMAPEQWRRAATDARTDQFSFCVALYEALYGVRPFVGEWVSLMMQVERGVVPPPPPDSPVPRRLYKIVARGLATAPGERWPSLRALLTALARDPGRTRLRIAAAIGLLCAASAASYAVAVSRATERDLCTGGAAQISEVWSEARRARTGEFFAAAGQAYADELWPRVAGELDDYAHTWQDAHRDACQAHQRGETSGALLDRRMACLEQRKAALRETVTVLSEADPEVALHALEVVAHLPDLARCSDITTLAADVAPPGDPEVRAAVDRLRPLVERVRTLEHAGLADAARTLADEVVHTATSIGERSLLAEALLARGRLEINRYDNRSDNDAVLTRAYHTALGGRLDELATEALALRMYIRSRQDGKAALALDDLAVAQEMLARLPSRTPVHGLVLNNAGVVYLASGDPTRAAQLFREALAAREAVLGPDHLEVAFTLANLALVGEPDERGPLLQRALAIFDHVLGRAHPQTIEVRIAAGFYTLDPREARALIAPGCAALGRFSASDQAQRARCLAYLGHHAAEAGETEAAAAAFAEVEALLPDDTAGLRISPIEVAQMRGRAALYSGEHRPAIALLRARLADSTGEDWWQRRHHAELRLLLGLHLDAVGEREAAGAALTAAVAEFTEVAAHSPDVLLQQRLAGARTALSVHLLVGRPTPEQRNNAAALLHATIAWYREAGPGYAWRRAELDALARNAATR